MGAGSTTFRREDLEQGFEPDGCFYVKHAARIRDHKQIDLETDPPPELVIEIDITNLSLNKFPIFAGLGVPEVWRYHQGAVTIFQLDGAIYREQEVSKLFPGVTSAAVTRLIADSRRMKRTAWLRSVREWAQTLKTRA